MGRIRTVKPELLIHEGLQDLERQLKLPAILVFIGLFTQADREGRFRWKPRVLKLAILPFMPFDMDVAMNGLHYGGYIRKYEQDGELYGDIPTFSEHQKVNAHEAQSYLPAYEDAYACTCIIPEGAGPHMHARGEGKGREGSGKRKGKAPSDAGASASPIFLKLPLASGGEHGVTEADLSELSELFPAVDVRQAIREILAWNNTNPTKRKTATGVQDHIRRWLAKIQNEGGNRGTSKDNSGSNGTRGAAVGRVERGQSAFRQAAIASVEASGGFDAGPDDSSLPFAGAPPGHGEDVPARSGDASGGVRDSSSGNGAGVVHHAPEILPPSQRNTGGVGSHGSQRAH